MRGPNLFLEYLNRPDATAEALHRRLVSHRRRRHPRSRRLPAHRRAPRHRPDQERRLQDRRRRDRERAARAPRRRRGRRHRRARRRPRRAHRRLDRPGRRPPPARRATSSPTTSPACSARTSARASCATSARCRATRWARSRRSGSRHERHRAARGRRASATAVPAPRSPPSPSAFAEFDADVVSTDPLAWPGYRRAAARARATARGEPESVVCGDARIGGVDAVLIAFDFGLPGRLDGRGDRPPGSPTPSSARAALRRPVVSLVASGGCRMQEGMRALAQMQRIAAACHRARAAGHRARQRPAHPHDRRRVGVAGRGRRRRSSRCPQRDGGVRRASRPRPAADSCAFTAEGKLAARAGRPGRRASPSCRRRSRSRSSCSPPARAPCPRRPRVPAALGRPDLAARRVGRGAARPRARAPARAGLPRPSLRRARDARGRPGRRARPRHAVRDRAARRPRDRLRRPDRHRHHARRLPHRRAPHPARRPPGPPDPHARSTRRAPPTTRPPKRAGVGPAIADLFAADRRRARSRHHAGDRRGRLRRRARPRLAPTSSG